MNATASYQFTIIVPVFNERENLERLGEKLSAYLEHSSMKPACVLFIDDGSTDGGKEMLSEICRRHRDFYYPMAALSGHFLKLLRYHALLQKGTPRGEILSQLGINPYFAGEYETAVRNYPARKTMQVISLLKEYDQKSKSNTRGEASDGDLLKELTARILA